MTEAISQCKQVTLTDITSNKDYMMRKALDKELVTQYKENLDALPPITVFDTPQGLVLADGFHRLAAARQLNKDKINATVIKGSVQDAFSHACLANLKHGKPLAPDEKKRAICEYIKLNAKFSNVVLARTSGSSEPTIRRYRQELETKGELEPQETRVGLNNNLIDTSNICSSSDDEDDQTTLTPTPFDLWFDERVSQGDALEILKDDQLKYDLAIVDPPYGITSEAWDKRDKFELLTFTRRWLNLVVNRLKPSGRVFIFWSREYLFDLKPLLDEIKTDYPLNFGGLLVWNFRNTLAMPGNQREFKLTWEPIFYFYKPDAEKLNYPDSEISGKKWGDNIGSDVLTFAIPQSNFNDTRIHPTQKPLELYKHIIELCTKPNDLILDPFAGSGTTGHAAYELGREFRLIEQNPEYIEAMRSRLKGVFVE